jgi:hypothetical protein
MFGSVFRLFGCPAEEVKQLQAAHGSHHKETGTIVDDKIKSCGLWLLNAGERKR